MEKSSSYLVKITPEAEAYYSQLLHYLYKTHSVESASKKSTEVLELALSLSSNPNRGRKEADLEYLQKGHQFLVYSISKRKTVKVIYFVEEDKKQVQVTDFFPTEMDPAKITR